jgi:triphosphoribosyl-dephospho-CoA synthase
VNSHDANNPAKLGLSIGQMATLACLLEATAPKPGNVHRGADFDDLTFIDLAASGVAIGAAIDRALAFDAPDGRLGRVVLVAVDAMNAACQSNAYLGTILLIAPLAIVPSEQSLGQGVNEVLQSLTAHDSSDVYEAIRRARPGGLGNASQHDVAGSPPNDLIVAMSAAAERDLVARQYTNGFREVLDEAAPLIESARASGISTSLAIVHAHVTLISSHGDSLIARKCGETISRQAAVRAQGVLDAGPPQGDDYFAALADFDFWLRSDGHRRNPGTTADLIGAALFALLREGRLPPPWR